LLSGFSVHLYLFNVLKRTLKLIVSPQLPLQFKDKDESRHQNVDTDSEHDEENKNVSDSLLGFVGVNKSKNNLLKHNEDQNHSFIKHLHPILVP
jgi:hypothetical protein